MIARFTTAFLFITLTCFSQNQETKDSLVNKICKAIEINKDELDSTQFFLVLENHLRPFLLNYSKENWQEIGKNIYFRLQRNCPEFATLLNKMRPLSHGWKIVNEKPVIQLNGGGCEYFYTCKKYRYIESTGDTVELEIKDGYWIDHFKDGTFSKLKFQQINECEFEISFIESNNEIRKNFSKVNDIYYYQIVDKKENYYDMSMRIHGSNKFYLFRMYY